MLGGTCDHGPSGGEKCFKSGRNVDKTWARPKMRSTSGQKAWSNLGEEALVHGAREVAPQLLGQAVHDPAALPHLTPVISTSI
jgi:hypothetical protein